MFGWGHSKKQSPRDIQIGQLKKTYPSVHETAQGEHDVFDISSRTHGGTNFTIRIVVRKFFPDERPVILVYTPPGSEFRHPSVDPTTHEITGMDKLNKWQSQGSLVDVVNEALILGSRLDSYRVRDGQPQGVPAYSPQGVAQPQNSYGQGSSSAGQTQRQPSYNSYTNAFLSTSQRDLQPPPPAYDEVKATKTEPDPPPPAKERKQSEEFHSVVLDVPTSFPELKQLSESQLERLLNDDVALKAHMSSIGAVSSLRELRESVRSSNLDNAIDAMKVEADIKALAEECTALQGSLRQMVTEFLSARDNLNKRHSVNAADVKSKLEAKLSNCDMESEALGDDFVNGVVDLQTFLQNYRALRVEYHSLDIKKNSMV